MPMLSKDYAGAALSEIEYDAIALNRVSGTLLAKELALTDTAWFDYRLMHPTHRTYLFAHAYDLAYRHMLRLHVDYKQAEGPNPRSFFPKVDPLGKTKAQLAREAKTGKAAGYRQTTMTWKARQAADRLGIPYDVFCMSGMKAAIGRIWKRTPTPAQLYSENILDAIIERWAEYATQRIFAAEHPFFTLKQWRSHPAQTEHAEWLCSQIRCRCNPELALAQYGFMKHLIPPQLMKNHFTDSVIHTAHRLSVELSINPKIK